MSLILLIIWLILPAVIIISWLRAYYEAMLKYRHSRILYDFCKVRDAIAIKAIEGEISESSQIFKFFYQINAKVIHENTQHGWCYVQLMRKLRPWNNSTPSTQSLDLKSEIEQASDETKAIVSIYVKAMFYAMLTAAPVILKDAIMFRLLSCWASFPLVSSKHKQPAEFGLGLARASGAFSVC